MPGPPYLRQRRQATGYETSSRAGRSPGSQKKAVHPLSITTFQLNPNDQLKPSDPTTPGAFPLRLLPSGPDLVRGTPPRGTWLSTHHEGASPTASNLKREFDPGRASSGLQGIANSPSSTTSRECTESCAGCQFRAGTGARSAAHGYNAAAQRHSERSARRLAPMTTGYCNGGK